MADNIAIELVLIENEGEGDELYVLDWEYDREDNKILYFKLFPLKDWLRGRHDPPEYVVHKGDLILYARDKSGYMSTSHRLKTSDDGEKFYDEYGRRFLRRKDRKTLHDCKVQLMYLRDLKELGEEEVKKRVRGED